MIDQPRVSIITPFLNAARHLQDAIDSVKAQTIESWELLLVDDGSSDGAREIALRAVEGDPRIQLLSRSDHSRKGAAAARNDAIKMARGSFVAFLDADDVYERSMLEITTAAADAFPDAAVIFGPTLWWHPDGEHPDWLERMDDVANRLHQPPSLLSKLILLQDSHVPCTCSVLVRRSALELTGGFEEAFRLYEDQALWVKLFLRFPAYVTPACLSRYRQHAYSVSFAAAREGLYDRLAAHPARRVFLDWVANHVAASGIRDRKLERALRLARSPYVEKPTAVTHIERQTLQSLMLVMKIRKRLRRMIAQSST